MQKARCKQQACCLLLAGGLLGFLFDLDDGGSTFLRNLCKFCRNTHGTTPKILI
jgi:hypothetical protein